MRFKGVLFQALGKHGSRVDRSFDVEWSQAGVESVFPELVAPSKDGVQLWAAAEYRIGANRGLAGLECLHAAVLDKDCADLGDLEATVRHLDAQGLAYILYSSWSHLDEKKAHTDSGKHGPFACYRVVLPFDKPTTPDEYRVLVPGLFGQEVPADAPYYAAEVLGRWVETASGTERAARPRGWDPASARPAQSWYVPATPPERAHLAVLDVRPGRPLDVEEILHRPTTARVSAIRSRPFQRPTAEAVGALRDISQVFQQRGIHLGAEGFEGWRRAPCPACAPTGVQRSPSFRCRANGDGVDVNCFAQCRRSEILAALGLDDKGRFGSPSELQVRLEEQLQRQATHDASVPVSQAVLRLVDDIRDAVLNQEPTVIQYGAGVGKSYASAQVLTERARAGYKIAYSTQTHEVAHETRNYLPPDVYAKSVHIHSPLVQVGNEPVCRRADELKEPVFEFGVSLLGKVCPRCPFRNECEAYATAKERARSLASANVIFVSHAGINQVFGTDPQGVRRGDDIELIVDEMPGTFERVEVTPHQLEALERTILPSAPTTIARVVQELARAYRAGEAPGQITYGPEKTPLGNASELAAEWGRLSVHEDARPSPAEQQLLRAADALVRLEAHKATGGLVEGAQHRGHVPLAAMLPDACHEALVRRKGVLLSATPMLAALPGFAVRSCAVSDGAPVKRVMVLRGGRGSKALTTSYWDEELGRRVRRQPEPGDPPGFPWPAVDAALERALGEAKQYDPPRVLFVTFKALADALRADPVRLRGGLVQVAHYGALRGLNQWQQGQPTECSVVYCFGTPRFAVYSSLLQLGLVGEAADQAWVAFAAGEIEQAIGRLRLPRRTKPATCFVEGDVAALSWTQDNINEINTEDTSEAGLYEAALFWRSREDVDFLLADGEPLTALAFPEIVEALELMQSLPPKRLALMDSEFSWAPVGE